MKWFFSLIFVLCFSLLTIAQSSIPVGSSHEVNQFLKRTTCFVLKDELLSDYNDNLTQAVSEHWSLTPYQFISASEFEEMRFDDAYSFVVANIVYFEKDKSQTKFDFLIATLGGAYSTIDNMPTLCAVPLCYHGADEEDYAYKTALVVRFIQHHLLICKEHPDLNENSIVNFYNSQPGLLSNKKLFVLRDELANDINQDATFSQNYSGEFEIADKETIQSLIENADENAAILHLIKPRSNSGLDRCFKLIVGAGDARMYYYDMHSINKKKPAVLLRSDLKKLK